jgi:hypothetical protein
MIWTVAVVVDGDGGGSRDGDDENDKTIKQ